MSLYTCELFEIIEGIPDENFESTREESLIESIESEDFADVLLFIRTHTLDKWFARGCDVIKDNHLCYTSGSELQEDIFRSELCYEVRISEDGKPLKERLKLFTSAAMFLI